MGFIGMVFPLEHKPEHHCGEKAAVGIHLALDSTVPERVAESINKRTGKRTRLNGNELAQCAYLPVGSNQLACEVADAPEKEHDTCRTEKRAHDIHHQSHLCGVAYKLSEKITRKHKEGRTGGMSHLQLIGGGNEFRAVPETCRRLHCAAIHKGCNGKCNPTHQVVYKSELFHLYLLIF